MVFIWDKWYNNENVYCKENKYSSKLLRLRNYRYIAFLLLGGEALMANYLYIVVVSIRLFYTIIRDIYLFNKGKYNPYIYRKEKKEFPYIVRLGTALGICIGGFVFLTNIKLLSIMTVIFLCYSFCLIVCVSVLNYLSYMKIKDKKIIFHTIIFDITIIIVSTGIWKYIMR